MMKTKEQKFQEEREAYLKLANSSLLFVEKMFGLTPQPPKPEYKLKLEYIITLEHDEWEKGKELVTADWFGDYDEEYHMYNWYDFQKGKHITWQQYLLLLSYDKAIQKKAKSKISIASGHGCHAKGTEIMMSDGTIKVVEDIVVGDQLMGDDGTPRNVLQLVRGKEQMYRIQYHSGEYYDVNESHILSVIASQTHGKQKRGDITNITVKDYLGWSKRKQRTNIGYKAKFEFKHKELPIDPYLLGVWLGDGSTDNGIITNPDKEIHNDLLSRFAGKIIPGECDQIRINDFTTLLNKNGLLGDKHIPHIYKTASREQRLELLAGLLDTDGYYQNSGYEIIQKKKQLADDIIFLARSLGMNATIHKKKGEIKSINFIGEYYRVNIMRNVWDIPCRVVRKQSKKPLTTQRDTLNYGFTVKKLGIDHYYGFTVNQNNLYVLGDFTVTHNCGKSSSVSWLILHFLFGKYGSQVPCTAPTATQMHDVLWKELSIWISKMPKPFADLYDWNKDYIRMKEAPNEWFARAKTSSKENSEALAGVHADWVLTVADEASGIEEQIFNVAQGAWTSGNIVVILISNPTRNIGFFYDTHHKYKKNWQTLQFSSIGSPIVDPDYEGQIAERHGRDSQEYGIRVLGVFPREDDMDDGGFLPLIADRNIHLIPADNVIFRGNAILGVDPAGEGDDKTVFVIRDQNKAMKIYSEDKSNEKTIAERALSFIEEYKIDPRNVVIDDFGSVGAKVAKEIAIASRGKINVSPINVGDKCDYEAERELYENKRAYMYWKLREWAIAGGSFVEDKTLHDELLTIRYKRNVAGRIQIMSKLLMKKKYSYSSPNIADAIALTFLRDIQAMNYRERQEVQAMEDTQDFDPYSVWG